ncbi:hypothetical protein C2S52_016279 [Perilla frutescens var. hirtella]|nr:hypothetical protein C2S52_016279 [Perilla frutescens var. hirtella]
MAAARSESVNVASTNTTALLSSSSNPRLCSSSYSCPPPSYTRDSSPSISATDFIGELPVKKVTKLPKILRFVLPPSVISVAAAATICICCCRKKKPAAAQTAADASGDAKLAEV